ncbi:helix-turn-helix transcriptional regulator [Gordonia soli]|uniref:Putative Xre family DNA-binding protein n=1 Tax=Gordonia soli NBRC 108243 TaxID=1223545 RepID=M0QNR5_9ACTN|nr:helix-turn-helix transcriptional regulator [Gordonia soli]GAC70305.1 putative Xre family DNA-binding protein [Gordonia soli NBRC 108243]
MTVGVGELLRQWRARRSLSQLDLAYDVGVSPRHLSFVETGKSTPSPALLDALSQRLDIPLRERNSLLLAAGHAPRYSEAPLGDAQLARVQESVQRLLDAHDPYPGVALDRTWDVVLANRAATRLIGLLPEHLAQPPLNLFRASLHPDGLSGYTRNFDEWAIYLVGLLRRMSRVTGDRRLVALEAEVADYATVRALERPGSRGRSRAVDELLIPFELDLGGSILSFFTTLTTFGSPLDITLDEMTVELFYPADDATEHAIRTATVGAGHE